MPSSDDAWAVVADRYVDHYRSVRGRVRTHVIDSHLAMHLPPPPAKVVDIGGGAGHQSLPLARRGYQVCLVDPSPSMLAHARSSVEAEPVDVGARFRTVEAVGQDAPSILAPERFDAVLCHGVLPYLEDPARLIAALCDLAVPGGLISIVAKNRDALPMMPALKEDWDAAIAAIDATHEVNRLGLPTRADTVPGIAAILEDNLVEVVDWYGVHFFSDVFTDREPEHVDALLELELEMSRRDPYRQLSRLFHILGRRRVRPS